MSSSCGPEAGWVPCITPVTVRVICYLFYDLWCSIWFGPGFRDGPLQASVPQNYSLLELEGTTSDPGSQTPHFTDDKTKVWIRTKYIIYGSWSIFPMPRPQAWKSFPFGKEPRRGRKVGSVFRLARTLLNGVHSASLSFPPLDYRSSSDSCFHSAHHNPRTDLPQHLFKM